MEDLMRIRDKILNYKLSDSEIGNLGYTRILLQVFGRTGHGKSSFINSLRYALLGGKFVTKAPEASATASQGGHTQKRTSYPLTDVIVLVDNRGFGKSDSNEKEEVYAQLANLQPLDEEVVWHKSFDVRMTAITEAKHNSNDLLLPIFIHSVQCMISNEEKAEYSEFLKCASNITGFQPIIILTKQSLGDLKTQEQHFKDFRMEQIFPVENYTLQDHLKTPGKDLTFLTILDRVLDLVNFRAKTASSFGTPEEEHRKRVQMMLKIAHNNELERERERLLAKWNNEQQEKKTKKKPCAFQ